MANPFKSVTCSVRYDNARIISWSMLPGGNYPEDFILEVENSRDGGPWETIATNLTNVCAYVDTRRRNYNKYMNENYRVRLKSESTHQNWVSEPVHAGYTDVYPFSSEAQNILKQTQNAIRISGCSGVLLKKKTWGTKCPDCVDFDGQVSVNEHCPKCLGTGILGGYYNGISMGVIKDQIVNKEDDAVMGYNQLETVSGRCIAYPWIRNGDVWVEDGTNKRYNITEAVVISAYKTVPLILKVTMHLLERTDVLYIDPASAKVTLKDVFASAEVTYTPQTEAAQETNSMNSWQATLDNTL